MIREHDVQALAWLDSGIAVVAVSGRLGFWALKEGQEQFGLTFEGEIRPDPCFLEQAGGSLYCIYPQEVTMIRQDS